MEIGQIQLYAYECLLTSYLLTAFGYTPIENDPFVNAAETAQAAMTAALRPGKYLVDLIPALQYVPEWVPGARDFKSTAREGRAVTEKLLAGAWDWAVNQYERGLAQPSLFSRLMDEHKRGELKQDLKDLRQDCALIYASTWHLIPLFFLDRRLIFGLYSGYRRNNGHSYKLCPCDASCTRSTEPSTPRA
jgi:hypothetical protein